VEGIREERAWLLRSRFSPFPIPGSLELTDGRLSFTLDGGAAEARLGWLEEELGIDGLPSRLEQGRSLVAFDHALADCIVSWPLTGGGAQMVVEAPDRRWIVSYEDPAAGKLSHRLGLFSGRRRAKDWKRALAGPSA
jgi:hypothetical protein